MLITENNKNFVWAFSLSSPLMIAGWYMNYRATKSIFNILLIMSIVGISDIILLIKHYQQVKKNEIIWNEIKNTINWYEY
jgi:hypothetical protein